MNISKTSLYATGVAALAAGFIGGTQSASALQCDTVYNVRSGDSLSKIAKAAYGSAGNFQIIYSANATRIGPNPGLIEIGLPLEIPCLGGNSTSIAAPIQAAATTEQLPAPEMRKIRMITGTGWAPFTNEDQEQGGMITEIANVALANSENKTEYQIDFINDWGAHLRPLITDHAYDFSIAWFKPNCAKADKLGDDSKFRCNNFDWSQPMFEQLFGYYTRAAEPTLVSYSDMKGKNICRPAGYATFQLEENDLVEPNIVLHRPNDPNECFTGLVSGKYDVVALAIDTAEGAMGETGTTEQVRYNEDLSQVLTIHAVISNTNPNRKEMLAELNSGLQAIKDTGEWFSIIRRHLTAHRAKTAGS